MKWLSEKKSHFCKIIPKLLLNKNWGGKKAESIYHLLRSFYLIKLEKESFISTFHIVH